MGAPILYRWTGDAMEPLSRFRDRCNAEMVVGEIYRCEVIEERSLASHNHYFAALKDAWLNLPDDIAPKFADPVALRKHALIACGYRDERRFVSTSPLEARKLLAWLKPLDEYAVYSVADNVVIEWRAKSQKRKAMGGPTFQKSKQDVLDYVAGMIGVAPAQLSAEAGKAA